ncbi:MAG: hypothetical protein IIA44_01930 [Acidobacteria bacterium]|nr:hypothetical protein [Acidobacteriota bacterium]
MTRSSDYQGEMFAPLSISDTDAEELMTGADGVRSDLGDLADVLGYIRTAGQAFVDTDISRLARAAALEARAVPAARLDAAQAAARSEWMARMAPRVAVGALALIMLVVSSTGLAFAANGAKPGDMLYGLDRAAEILGIGDGGSNERIAEAHALVASGAVAVGLTHAAAVLPATPDNEMAKAAIQKAATRVQGEPQGPSSYVAEQVGTLLSYLRLATAAGTVNTSTLAGFAEAIGEPPTAAPGQSGDTPGQAGTTPGQAGTTPGQAGTTPGQGETTPGQGETVPGQDADVSGQEDEGPGQSGDAPGQSGDTPGQSGDTPGQSGDTPGQGGATSGQSEDLTDQSGDTPGPPDDAPGQSEDVPPGTPDNTPGATNPGGGRS